MEGSTRKRSPRRLSRACAKMTAADCEQMLSAAEQRLSLYRHQQETLVGSESETFYRSLRVQGESRIRECEAQITALRTRLTQLRGGSMNSE